MLLTEQQSKAIASFAAMFNKDIPDMFKVAILDRDPETNIPRVVVTNRYLAVYLSLGDIEAPDLTEQTLIPEAILKVMKTAKGAVEIAISDNDITFSNGASSTSAARPNTNMPDLWELKPNAADLMPLSTPNGLKLNLTFMAAIAKFVSPTDNKATDPVWQFFSIQSPKPVAPIVLTRADLTAILQPVRL